MENHITIAALSWRDSDLVCALADSDRHLGHIVMAGDWKAYDATMPNESSTGFRFLGTFNDVAAAKRVVELSVATARLRAMRALSGLTN
jgi:hypothetical protein